MNDLYRISDTYRQSLELEAARIEEVKNKLVLTSENKLLSKLFILFGNGKIVSQSEASLTQITGVSSSDILFDGDIKVTAIISDKKVSLPISVKANVIEIIDDEDLKDLVEKTEIKTEGEEAINIVQAFPIQADLSQFFLHDDGSEYLKVYHPSLDMNKELGVISKEEYESLKDKEAFFKSTLENQIKNSELENHYDLNYTGSFSEPSIQSIHTESIITSADLEKKETVTKTAVLEEPVEKAAEEDNLFLAHQADSYRQAEESEIQKTQAEVEKLSTNLANDVVSHLRNLRYSDVKVLSVDNSDVTAFKVTSSLIDEVGEKIVTFSIPIRDFSYSLPKKEVIAKLVSETEDLQSKIAESIASDTLARLKEIDDAEVWKETETQAALEDEKITKTAGSDSGGTMFLGSVDVLNMDKHTLASSGIPEDLEVGEKIFADGAYWVLTDKDHDNLGKEANSGSIWTFSKVSLSSTIPEKQVNKIIG